MDLIENMGIVEVLHGYGIGFEVFFEDLEKGKGEKGLKYWILIPDQVKLVPFRAIVTRGIKMLYVRRGGQERDIVWWLWGWGGESCGFDCFGCFGCFLLLL